MNHLSDNSYLAIKPESTAGTAVLPTVFVPLVSESMKTVANLVPDRRLKGIDWKSNDLLRGNRSHEGEVIVYGDADTLGHFLNMVLEKGATTGDADGYIHPFTVGTAKTYTIEIKKGAYTQRYFGCSIDELKLDFEDGKLKVTAKIMAMGQVSIATIGVAINGSVTSATLDDNYDLAPNRGLVIGDVLNIGGTDVTLTSVDAGGLVVGFASTALVAAVGSVAYLVPQTAPSITVQEPLRFGNVLVGFGTDATDADGNATQADATPVYDLTIVLKNNLFAQNGSNRIDPVQILPRTREAQVELRQLFTSPAQRQAWLERTKQAMVINIQGKNIKSDFTTFENLTLTLNRVKLIENDNAIQVGEYIADAQKFEVLYDDTDGQALDAELTNRTASATY